MTDSHFADWDLATSEQQDNFIRWSGLLNAQHITAIEEMIADGEDVSQKFFNGSTPLHLACESSGDKSKCVIALLKAGARVNERDGEGKTPFYIASYESYPPTLKVLIKAGANTHTKDNEGKTPADEAKRGVYMRNLMKSCIDDFRGRK